jgi:hypothetical protein
VLCKIEQWDHVTTQIDYGRGHSRRCRLG